MSKITPIEAAFLERDGEGAFERRGKQVVFCRASGGTVSCGWFATEADAEWQIHVLRAAPHYVTRAECKDPAYDAALKELHPGWYDEDQ